VVLVNGGTASTSELLAGSLHAGGRAAMVGEHTFGKGRTQKVLQLHDNSTLLVSNSLVTTPALERIDKVHPFTHHAHPPGIALSYWHWQGALQLVCVCKVPSTC
jgi:hypothetical protein